MVTHLSTVPSSEASPHRRWQLANGGPRIGVARSAFQSRGTRLPRREILGEYLCAAQAIIAASERNPGSYVGVINSTYRTNLIEHSQMVIIKIYSRLRSPGLVIINFNIP